VPANSREEWDRIFARLEGGPGGEDAWLERWRDLILRSNRGAPVLDLGCGAGEDALLLSGWGFGVVAADFSGKALELASRRAPEAERRHVDITEGLPFPDAHFGAIVASLSLHYFPWSETVEVLEDVGRCLVPGGHLLARLNSTNDPHYAAARKEEIEPNFYLVDGSPKRLFDRDDVVALFRQDWKIEAAVERTTSRYGGEKTLWEIVARKPAGRGP
jgi:SAM-dependent methyltransferase